MIVLSARMSFAINGRWHFLMRPKRTRAAGAGPVLLDRAEREPTPALARMIGKDGANLASVEPDILQRPSVDLLKRAVIAAVCSGNVVREEQPCAKCAYTAADAWRSFVKTVSRRVRPSLALAAP